MTPETYQEYINNIKEYLASPQSAVFDPLNLSRVFSHVVLHEPLTA